MSRNRAVLLGIDVGSSGAKATAIDQAGNLLGQGRSEYPTNYPRSGWAEQDAQDWFTGACAAIKGCLDSDRFSGRDVSGIAFVGPAHNVVLLDREDRALRPVIHWSDIRSVHESEELTRLAGDSIFETSGQPVNPSWTLSQLLWLKRNEPSTWTRLKRILVTKDYVRRRFTGDYLTDPFDAVGTQLYDLRRKSWSRELCALLDIHADELPEVRPSDSIAGGLTPGVASELGLVAGIPVAVGGADTAVEAFGAGSVSAGYGVVKVGTSCCIDVVTTNLVTSRQTLTYPYLFDNLGLSLAVTTNGTAALKWFRSELLAGRELSFEEIVNLAGESRPGCNGLIFHPYLMGERTPYWDPRLRGGFIGLGPHHGLRDLARAILEGVAFTLRDCLDTLKAMELPIKRLALLGGGTMSALWSGIVASTLRTELARPSVTDASFGAALLAGVAVDAFPSWKDAADNDTASGEMIRPNVKDADVYDGYYEVFRRATKDLAATYHTLHDLSERSRA